MSDSPQPPSLRLKPKLRVEADSTAPAAAPAPAPVPSESLATESPASLPVATPIPEAPPAEVSPPPLAPDESGPRLRLRPVEGNGSEAPAVAPAPVRSPLFAPPPPQAPVPSLTKPPMAPGVPHALPPRVPTGPTPPPLAVPVAAPTAAAATSGPSSAPKTVTAPPFSVATTPPPLPPAGAPTRPPMSVPAALPKMPPIKPKTAATPPSAKASSGKGKGLRTGVLTLLFGSVVLIGAGVFFAWSYLFAPPEPPPRRIAKPKVVEPAETAPVGPANNAAPAHTNAATADTPVAKAPEKPSLLASQNTALSKPIAKTEEVLAARAANVAGSDEVLGSDDGRSGATFVPRDAVSSSSGKDDRAVSTFAPGLSGSNRDVAASGKVSTAFRRYVGEMVIRGVFQGTNPRAHINGRIVIAGDLVDKNLGIIFDSVDAEKKTITFRDGTGATISRRY